MLGRLGKDAGSLLGVEIAADSVRMLQLQGRQGLSTSGPGRISRCRGQLAMTGRKPQIL